METLNKNAVNKGLIIAAFSIVITLLMYYVMPSMLGNMASGAFVAIAMLILYITLTLDLRKQVGGFWSFKEALKGIFLMAVVACLVSQVFLALYWSFVETGAYEKLEGIMSEAMAKNMETFGVPADQIDAQVEEQMKGIKATYSPTFIDTLKTTCYYLIFAFVMSLIFAAIFKKNPPVFLETVEE